MSAVKSYSISKLTVWEAFQRVKANRGAAGIDEQSIAQFEQKLQRNLTHFSKRNVEIPYRSPWGQPFAKVAYGGAGKGTRKKRTPSCNGLDRS
jgi:hypothetical protein